MNVWVEQFNDELLSLLSAIQALPYDSGTTLADLFGYEYPIVSKDDLENLLKEIFESYPGIPNELPSMYQERLKNLTYRLRYYRENVFGSIQEDQGRRAIPALILLLLRAKSTFDSIKSAFEYPSNSTIRQLREIAEGGPSPETLVEQFLAIKENIGWLGENVLPYQVKLQEIDRGKESLDTVKYGIPILQDAIDHSQTNNAKIAKSAEQAAATVKEMEEHIGKVRAILSDSEEKYNKLEDVYQAASRHGLASAFERKAAQLESSLTKWVSMLVVVIVVGLVYGFFQFGKLQNVLLADQKSSIIWANVIICILGFAGPVWLAWLATKQISQRFKLAEDYGFKASVASAYEAWKNEAIHLDEEFRQRLFGNALSRLEEAPLRFMEQENFGSPWHELISSKAFSEALAQIPELKDIFIRAVSSAGGTAASVAAALPAKKSGNEKIDEAKS